MCEKIINDRDWHASPNQKIPHVFSEIKKSKVHPNVYYVTEFVRVAPLGEKNTHYDEFHIGQTYKGYTGFFRAYIFIPAHWEFAKLSTDEMSKTVEFYGNKVVYKGIESPDGSLIANHMCIGWSYDFGLDDERLIGLNDIGRDVSNVLKDIVTYEWDVNPDVMLKSAVNKVYDAIKGLRYGVDNFSISTESQAEIYALMHELDETVGRYGE